MTAVLDFLANYGTGRSLIIVIFATAEITLSFCLFFLILLREGLILHFYLHRHLVGCVSHLNATDAVESTQPKKLFFFIPGEEGILSASCTQCKRILPLSIDLFLVDVVVIDVVNIEHFLLVYYF